MGFFDRLKERNTPQEESQPVTQSFEGTDFQPSADQAQDLSANDELRNFASTPAMPEGRLYNPYEGISSAVDPRVLRSVYKLPSQPEFLFSEEATVHKRSISENLTYYTGVGYLTGSIVGAGRGAIEATRPNSSLPAVDSARLRLNRFLNMSGRSGRVAGNALGILGLFFSISESGLGYLNDGQVPDWLTTLGAGFATGALFRSARGPKAAAIAGGVGSVAAGALLTARETIAKGL